MNNINQNNGESKNIQNLRAIIDRFSKGARKNVKHIEISNYTVQKHKATDGKNVKHTVAKSDENSITF